MNIDSNQFDPLTSCYPNNVNVIQAYWLLTSKNRIADKLVITNDMANRVKFVLTAELQGCTIYANHRADITEFFHYNRYDLHTIKLNSYKNEKIDLKTDIFFNTKFYATEKNGQQKLLAITNPDLIVDSNGRCSVY